MDETPKVVDHTEEAIPLPQESASHRVLISIIVVIIFVISIVSVYVFHRNSQQKSIVSERAVPTKEIVQQVNTMPYATKDTQLATSLDVPQLYPSAQWTAATDTPATPDFTGLYYATASTSGASRSFFSGTTSATTLPFDPNDKNAIWKLENYYEDVVLKEGWIGPDAKVQELVLNKFTMLPNVSDGVCGGVKEYIGFKDDLVRVVAIRQERYPCNPPFITPDPPGTKYTISYVVFISDPTPIQKIADYVQQHPGDPIGH